MSTTTTAQNDNNNNEPPEPTEAESKMTEAIARDRPTIDAAVKSFISMVCARTMAASATDATHDKVMMGIIPSLAKSSISDTNSSSSSSTTEATAPTDSSNKDKTKEKSQSTTTTTTSPSVQQQVLEVARCILRAVNGYTFPIQDTVAYSKAEKPGTSAEKKQELLEISVVARLWNALVQSEQKPSRFLGRRALKLAWKHLDVETRLSNNNNNNAEEDALLQVVRERQKEWLQRFESLLFATTEPLPSDINVDDDSALLWAPDGGAAELAKRRQRRLDAAKKRGPVTPS